MAQLLALLAFLGGIILLTRWVSGGRRQLGLYMAGIAAMALMLVCQSVAVHQPWLLLGLLVLPVTGVYDMRKARRQNS